MKLRCYKCDAILKNQEDLARIMKKYDCCIFQCPDCTEKEIKKSEENNMIIKFKQGIDKKGHDYSLMYFDDILKVNEKSNGNMNVREDGYVDASSRNFERIIEYLYGVTFSGYLTSCEFSVGLGDQFKKFSFSEKMDLDKGFQERLTKIREWVNSLPCEKNWQVEITI